MRRYQAAVIGGGPTGLAAALTLARSLQPTIVFESPAPARNAASHGIGGLLGRDLIQPSALRQAARKEIARYGHVDFEERAVERLEGDWARGFTIAAAGGGGAEVASTLLACGMVDQFPEIEGLAQFWGKTIINCPFCVGFEVQGRAWAVLINRPGMLDVAEIYSMWTDDLILIVEPEIELTADREAELVAKGIGIERRRLRRCLGKASALRALEMADGAILEREVMVVWPQQTLTELVSSLDLTLNEDGCVGIDEGFRTVREGIYAAGDLAYAGHQNVNTALHMGNLAAASMVLDLSRKRPRGRGK